MVKGKMYFYNKLMNTNVPYRGSSVLQMRAHLESQYFGCRISNTFLKGSDTSEMSSIPINIL